MKIHGFAKLTLLDYPGKIAATVFTGGCNFRCPFCHNGTLVLDPSSQPLISEETVLTELASRAAKLEGVCITGGEPTLNSDLPGFIEKIRAIGLLVKLDTNGTNPDMLKDMLDRKMVDHVAMDIKSSPSGYGKAAGLRDFSMDCIFRSVDLIMQHDTPYEFRTTVVEGIHELRDFLQIGAWLKGASAYYLQQFKSSEDMINPEGLKAPSREAMESFRRAVLPSIPNTQLRGVD